MDKNKANVPKIRFPGFTDPWQQRKLGDFTERVQGNDGRMNLPTLTMSASFGWMSQEDRFSENIAGKEQKNYTLLKKGQLSYNHGNSKLAKYGVVFELKDYREALVPRVYHSFKVIEGSAKFIDYYFSTKLPNRELGKLVSSGARMDGLLNINYNDFSNIMLTVPNTQEQVVIGNFFEKIDNFITLHQRKLNHLKDKKKSLLQKMFPKNGEDFPELRFPGFTDSWEQRKLGDVMNIITDYVAAGSFADIAKNVQYDSNPSYAQLVRTVDIKKKFCNNGFVYIDKKAFEYLWRVNLDEECIILPNIGANIGEVYYLSPVDLPYKNNVLGPNAILLKTTENTKLIYTLFQTEYFQNKLSLIVASSGQPKFNKTELKQIDLVLPNIEEQECIGEFFSNFDNLINLHQRKLNHLKEQKKALLQQMFI